MSQRASTTNQNSEFLLELLLEENKHLNPIDFIDPNNKASNFACVCIALGIIEKYKEIKDSFHNLDDFVAIYFPIYASALENYRSIVGNTDRQIFVDETKVFYPQKINVFTTSSLISNENNRIKPMELLESIKNDKSGMIILRDEIAFAVIHYQNDNYIVIDPHVAYCGILSKTGVFRYTVYDNIWNFDVNILTFDQLDPQTVNQVESNQSSQTVNQVGSKV